MGDKSLRKNEEKIKLYTKQNNFPTNEWIVTLKQKPAIH